MLTANEMRNQWVNINEETRYAMSKARWYLMENDRLIGCLKSEAEEKRGLRLYQQVYCRI